MRKIDFDKLSKTLTFKLTFGSQLLIIPLIFFLIFDNLYSINVLHNKVSESKKETLALYMNEIDAELKNVDDYILRILTSDLSIPNLENEYNEMREIAKVGLNNDLVQASSSYKLIDGLFIYSKKTGDYLYSYSSRTSYKQRMEVSEHLQGLIDEGKSFAGKRWFPTSVSSSQYLTRILNTGSIYVGAWVNTDTFISYLNRINPERTDSFVLVSNQGTPLNNIEFIKSNKINLLGGLETYYFSGVKKKFMVVGQESRQGHFRLTAVGNEKKLLEGLDHIQIVIFVIALLSVLYIPLTYILLRKCIFRPVENLAHAIKKKEDGNMIDNISREEHPVEFRLLIDTVNRFTSQISQLKIDVYEEQLRKQKAELQYLQTQIKPHFYLNALNTIYSMAQMKDYRLIQDMARCLSNYLRHMVRGNFSLVLFEEELKHVQNYLQIHQIRSGDNLTCQIDTAPSLMNLRIPPLILHTFIENIVKHAFTVYESIEIRIQGFLLENTPDKLACIVIEDSGKGFSNEALEQIHCDDDQKEDGKNIGIWNIKQRLKLMYNDKASVTVRNNSEGGARIEIIIPAEMEPERL